MTDIPEDVMKAAMEAVTPLLQEKGLMYAPKLELVIARAILAERERCASIASQFTMKPDRSIHPDIPWDQMNDAVKVTAHTTAQQIAVEIMGVEDGE